MRTSCSTPARGIRETDDRRLIIKSIFQSLLKKLDSGSLRAYFGRMISEKSGEGV